jgi:hypothetical protein
MSRTDTYLCTLGSSPPPAAAALMLTEPLSSMLRLGSQEGLPDDEELRSAKASTMDCALETLAGNVKDGGVPGVAAAEVWLFWICSSRYWLGVGVLVEVKRRPTQLAA